METGNIRNQAKRMGHQIYFSIQISTLFYSKGLNTQNYNKDRKNSNNYSIRIQRYLNLD